MVNSSSTGNRTGLWLTCVIHTALVFGAAPILYWVLICLQNLPFHFGMLVAASVGIPASYLLFGLPLLATSAASAAAALWLSKLKFIWWRFALGTVLGSLLGLALGQFILRELRNSEAYSMFWSPCLIVGGLIGLLLTSIWRLSDRWACKINNGITRRGVS
jgi:hypothetical protein